LATQNPHLATRGEAGKATPLRTGRPILSPGFIPKIFNVMGVMPHPENLIDPIIGGTDGRGLFESVANEVKVA
jgi:hypothetical protein